MKQGSFTRYKKFLQGRSRFACADLHSPEAGRCFLQNFVRTKVDSSVKESSCYPKLHPPLTKEYEHESLQWHPNMQSDLVRWRVVGWRGTKILRTASIFRDETEVDIIPLGFSVHPMKSMKVRMNPDNNNDDNSNQHWFKTSGVPNTCSILYRHNTVWLL